MKFNRRIRNLCASCILTLVPLQASHAAVGAEWRPSDISAEQEQRRIPPPPPPPAVLPSQFRPVAQGLAARMPPRGMSSPYASYPPRGGSMPAPSGQYGAPAFARQYAWRPISPPLVARAPQPPVAAPAPPWGWGYAVRRPMPMAPWVPPSPWAAGYAPPMPMPPQYGPPPPPPPPPWMPMSAPGQLAYGGYGVPWMPYGGGVRPGFAAPMAGFPGGAGRPFPSRYRQGALGRYGSFPGLSASPWGGGFPSFGAMPTPFGSPWGGWPGTPQAAFGWRPDAWIPGMGSPLGGSGFGLPLAGMFGDAGCLWCGG